MAAGERERLTRFCILVIRFIFREQPESKTLQEFERIEWNRSSLAGIRMAARDAVEWSKDLAGEQLAKLDAELASQGLPTLTAMRNVNYRKALAVLERGAVRNDEEWHMLNGLVADTSDLTLTSVEREQADRLVNEYRSK